MLATIAHYPSARPKTRKKLNADRKLWTEVYLVQPIHTQSVTLSICTIVYSTYKSTLQFNSIQMSFHSVCGCGCCFTFDGNRFAISHICELQIVNQSFYVWKSALSFLLYSNRYMKTFPSHLTLVCSFSAHFNTIYVSSIYRDRKTIQWEVWTRSSSFFPHLIHSQ